MQKKLFIFIIFVSLAFYSCLDYNLPDKIELEIEGSIGLPVKTSTSDWGAMMAKTLKNAFSGSMEEMGEGIEVYNVNYGQDFQAFCVYIPIKISDSLNPHDYLDGINLKESEKALDINEPIEVPSFKDHLLINETITILSDGKINIPDLSGNSLEFSEEFLHAQIAEGSLTISIYDGNGIQVIQPNYNLNINQASYTDSYGTTYKGFSEPATTITQEDKSLADKNINKNPISISGTITINNTSGGESQGTLKITMNISKYKELDWDFSNISDKLKADPVSLADAAAKMNWLEFDKCYDGNNEPYKDENGEPTKGIGININFTDLSDELKLKMSVGCSDLHIDETKQEDLHQGNNIFGNRYALKGITPSSEERKRLQLVDPGKVGDLNFSIKLIPNKPNNVLHIEDIEAGQTLNIKGEANFFLNWTQAGINMKEALSAELDGNGNFTGSFPDTTKEEPIDLSMLNEYLEGFSFKEITAAAYLSGPNKTIEKLSESRLEITAHYLDADQYLIMEQQPITLEKKHVIIQGNPDYLDKIDKDGNGTYKKEELPPDGNPLIDFEKIINAMPKDLSFSYKLEDIPPEMPVTPDMFEDENDEAHDILATVILLINMELTAGDDVVLTNGSKGGRIRFPDMFNGREDLLGRQADENNKPEDSVFTSLGVSHIGLTIDFSDSFFSGGNLFIEKNPILFPEGIHLDGSKIAINIKNEEFEKIKNNIIHPDFRLEFEKGEKVTIPRKIGLTSVKIEAKGKNSLVLDF